MRDEVIKMAVPEPSVLVPRVLVPSLKVTVPVGVTPELVTVAVNVTGWPYADGFAFDVSIVAVELIANTCCRIGVGEDTISVESTAKPPNTIIRKRKIPSAFVAFIMGIALRLGNSFKKDSVNDFT